MPHRPLVETLEARNLLSAVTAAVHDGTLFVVGTDVAETINVVGYPDGSTRVSAKAAGDKVAAQFVFEPWSYDSLFLDGRGGNDSLGANGVVLPKGGSVLGGDGNDKVLVVHSNVNGHFFVDGGEGDDLVSAGLGTFEGVSFHGGNGNDKVFASDAKIWSYATFDLGNGNDELRLTNVTVYGWTTAYGGDGDDLLVRRGTVLAGGSNVLDFEWDR